MSQLNVERTIGRLVTDEVTRIRFTNDPGAALRELVENGVALTEGERRSLASLDPEAISRFARSVDPRLQRSDLKGGGST
ncbi:MAG: Os1348 family NHLP clan protein [Hyphomicrobiales bacterium]